MIRTPYLILFVILITSVSVTAVYAQESSLPSWIKTIAGFWANDLISDDEFIGALQFLVKEGILVIPSEEPQIDPPSLELDSGPSDTAIPSSTPQQISPNIKALFKQGIGRSTILVLITLEDQKGNQIKSNGDLTLKFLNEDGDDLFSQKKYLTADVFKEYTNDISGETITGIQYTIDTGKFKQPNWEKGWYQGYEDVEVKLTFEDTTKTLHTNQILLSHLPLNEGFFSEDTGFVKFYETNEILNVGPFFIKIVGVGPYITEIDGKTDEYFRVNLETQYKQVSDVIFTIDEMYILDDKNNFIETEVESFDELKKAILVDNGYILFKDMTSNPSELTIFLKITVIELDESDTPYEDNAVITLR